MALRKHISEYGRRPWKEATETHIVETGSCRTTAKSIRLPTASDYLTFGDPTTLDGVEKMTLAYWVYKDIWDDISPHLYKFSGSGGSNSFHIQGTATNGLVVSIANALTDDWSTNFWRRNTGGSPFTPATWHHITVVYDGTQAVNEDRVKVYRNATLVTATDYAGTFPTQLTTGSTAVLKLGGTAPNTGTFEAGNFDDIAIIAGLAATEAEVTDLYNSCFDNFTLSHYWDFEDTYLDQGTSTTAADGTASGAPEFSTSVPS